jgi:hypothetical protein
MKNSITALGNWAALIPLAAALIFVIFYAIGQSILITSPTDSDGNPMHGAIDVKRLLNETPRAIKEGEQRSPQEMLAKQYEARMKWMFYSGANLLLNLFLVSLCVFLLGRSLGWGAAAAIVVGSLVLGAVFEAMAAAPLAKPLIEATVMKDGPPRIDTIMRVLNGASIAVAILIAVTISAILYEKKAKPDDAAADRLAELAGKRRQLTFLLYCSTATLVLAVLRSGASYEWYAAFLSPETAAALSSFLGSITAVLGGFFTLLLASVFLPAAYILQKKAEAEVVVTEKESVSDKLTSMGFTFSYAQEFSKILAIGGPFLAGILAELTKIS